MIIFGHRGAPGYPRHGENTRASFRKALRAGATALEFDVRRCGDGQIVVIHDDTIDRTTNGRGRLRDLSYEQLRRFDAGFGEPPPLLIDVLDEFGGRCLLNIELKEDGLTADVQKLINERSLQPRVLVSSFNWNELREFEPDIRRALLSSTLRNLISTARQMGAYAIHPRRNVVTRTLVATAHEQQLRVHVWTVNDVVEASRLRDIAVDGIFTDFPERLSAWADSTSH